DSAMKSNQARQLLWAVAATAAISTSAAYSRNRANGTLLSRATAVPGTKGRSGPYFWMTPRQLLTLQYAAGTYCPLKIDTESGAVTPLPPIPAQYATPEVRGSWRLSPDGTHLLWAQRNGMSFRWVSGDLRRATYLAEPYNSFD